MEAVYVPLLSALAGALIGSASSIITILIQLKSQGRKDRIKLATEIAREDYRNQVDRIKHNQSGGLIAPLYSYVHIHAGILRLMEADQLTPENMMKLLEENNQLTDRLAEFQSLDAAKQREQKEPGKPKPK